MLIYAINGILELVFYSLKNSLINPVFFLIEFDCNTVEAYIMLENSGFPEIPGISANDEAFPEMPDFFNCLRQLSYTRSKHRS
jgi:hypothetical protein